MMLLACALLTATATAAAPGDVTPEPGDATPAPDDVTRLRQIHALEQVKGELLKQLQGAIAEGAQSLNRSGDAAAAAGLLQIRELQDILASDRVPNTLSAQDLGRITSWPARRRFDQKGELVGSDAAVDSDKERRAQGIKNAKYWYDFFNLGESAKLKLSPQGFIGSNKWNKTKTNPAQELNKKLVADHLKQWILMKREEKRKRREWQLKFNAAHEMCPRWGRKKNKLYPCCRKCCKSSYLGCL